jgi:hypothetical protein
MSRGSKEVIMMFNADEGNLFRTYLEMSQGRVSR